MMDTSKTQRCQNCHMLLKNQVYYSVYDSYNKIQMWEK